MRASPTPSGPLAFLGAALGALAAFGAHEPPLAVVAMTGASATAGLFAAWIARRTVMGRFAPLFFAAPGLLGLGALLCTQTAQLGDAEILAVDAIALVGCALALAVLVDRARRPSRAGSLLDTFERRRGMLVALALASIAFSCAEGIGAFHGLAFLAAFVLGCAAFFAAATNAHALLEVTRVARGLSRARELSAPFVDFGVGAQTWAETEPAAPYRTSPTSGTRAAFGDFLAVHRAMAGGSIAEGAALVVVAVACALAVPRGAHAVFVPPASPAPPQPVVETKVVNTPGEMREAGWYPQTGPILADLDGDGVEDVIGVRWLYGKEEAGVTVMAVDGVTLSTIWRVAPSIPSEWSSNRVSLKRSGEVLFLSDSEGLLHRFSLADGSRRGDPIKLPPSARLHCAAGDGDPPRAWLWQRATGAGSWKPEGLLVDASGHLGDAERPAWCGADGYRICDTKGTGLCHRYELALDDVFPRETGARFAAGEAVESDGAGVTVGHAIRRGESDPRPYAVGYDVRTHKVTWQGPLDFTDEPIHEDAYPHVDIRYGKVLGLYEVASGKWILGARDDKTGEVAWATEVPRAVHGTSFENMTVTKTRIYVALSSRLEIFDLETGRSIGVVW